MSQLIEYLEKKYVLNNQRDWKLAIPQAYMLLLSLDFRESIHNQNYGCTMRVHISHKSTCVR